MSALSTLSLLVIFGFCSIIGIELYINMHYNSERIYTKSKTATGTVFFVGFLMSKMQKLDHAPIMYYFWASTRSFGW